jgi:indolepyruvate ferredoxin oxidoreductase alpha subunit
MAHGMELARLVDPAADDGHPVVGVIGDSTFAHSGITSLLSIAYNHGAGTIAILDNSTTAMTGQQGNPMNGRTLQQRPGRKLDIEALVRAMGVEDVRVVDAMNAQAVRSALEDATASSDLSVIVFRSPCVLVHRSRKAPFEVDEDACVACGACVSLGCPAIGTNPKSGKAHVQRDMCIGCGQCAQYCKFGALTTESRGEGA